MVCHEFIELEKCQVSAEQLQPIAAFPPQAEEDRCHGESDAVQAGQHFFEKDAEEVKSVAGPEPAEDLVQSAKK